MEHVKTDHMEYIEGMERTDSEIMERVLEAMGAMITLHTLNTTSDERFVKMKSMWRDLRRFYPRRLVSSGGDGGKGEAGDC